MPIAIDGQVHDSEMEYAVNNIKMDDKQRSDAQEMATNETSGDFQSRFGAIQGNPTHITIRPEQLIDSTKEPGLPDLTNPDWDSKDGINQTFSEGTTFGNRLFGTSDEPRYQTWPEKAVRGAIEGIGLFDGKTPTWAMDPATGEVRTDPQVIEKLTDLGEMVVGGPAPVASKMADGTLGSFMGVKSKTINKEALYKAQNAELDMVHPDTIWNDHGTFRGADGRWRQEIPDQNATLKDSAFDTTVIQKKTIETKPGWGYVGTKAEDFPTVSLKTKMDKGPDDAWGLADWLQTPTPKPHFLHEVLDHPELFKAYPDLKTIKVEPLPEYLKQSNAKGDTKVIAQVTGGHTIHLSDNLHPEFVKSVLLHEAQHVIQNIEGFARGGNQSQFLPAKLNQAKKLLEDAKSEVIPKIKEKGFSDREISTIKWASTLDKDTLQTLKNNKDSTVSLLERAEKEGVYNQIRNIGRSEELLKKAEDEVFEKYQRLMGEVEARNVQARMNFSNLERRHTPPKRTEDRDRSMQIEAK